MYSLSAERGELLSGARDAYLQYIGRLEARLRERELAVVDEKLVRSERQRFEAEANLAQVDEQQQRRSRVAQIEERTAAAAHTPRPPKARRQEGAEGQGAPSRADRTSDRTSDRISSAVSEVPGSAEACRSSASRRAA